ITPALGYQLSLTSFSADLRRSNSGTMLVRVAYSLDGGATWFDEGTNHSIVAGVCGVTTTFTWDLTDFTASQTLKFRIYGFSATATSGILQLLNVNLNGQVCAGSDADND